MERPNGDAASVGCELAGANLMNSFTATLRWLWRQLTSMRVALILLFLLALASVPGSLFPQRGTSPLKVSQYLRDHPDYGPWLDRLKMFDVFASPWFSAIYLLLFISLAGCVLPRAVEHFHELRGEPPAAPRNLSRLPAHVVWSSRSKPADVLAHTAEIWETKRWRVRVGDQWISAEKGYARETGNLLFHLSLLAILLAVGLGSAVSSKGTVIVREGSGFANNITQYDSFTPGRSFSAESMPTFSFTLQKFFASYQLGGQQNGAPREFYADVEVKTSPKAQATPVRIEVNKPLRVEGYSVYLVGHGYAPEFTVTNAQGEVVWQDAAVFLPQDGNFTSTGVVKIPDSVPQVGLQGFFLPTAVVDEIQGPHSIFPAPSDPEVFLSAWSGDLGLDNGIPQSVYRLDTANMQKIGLERLKPGAQWDFPNGQGSVKFEGFKEWASFSITRDPGKPWALLAGVLSIVGLCLSLLIPRRRIWLRITENQNGSSLFEVAGLSKTEAPGLIAEVEAMALLVKDFAVEESHGN